MPRHTSCRQRRLCWLPLRWPSSQPPSKACDLTLPGDEASGWSYHANRESSYQERAFGASVRLGSVRLSRCPPSRFLSRCPETGIIESMVALVPVPCEQIWMREESVRHCGHRAVFVCHSCRHESVNRNNLHDPLMARAQCRKVYQP